MTAQNKLSLTLTILCIAIGIGIAAISKAGSPATNQPLLFCGLTRDCAIG